jgi:hypothetical protein
LDKESLLATSDSIGNNKWEQENSYKKEFVFGYFIFVHACAAQWIIWLKDYQRN